MYAQWFSAGEETQPGQPGGRDRAPRRRAWRGDPVRYHHLHPPGPGHDHGHPGEAASAAARLRFSRPSRPRSGRCLSTRTCSHRRRTTRRTSAKHPVQTDAGPAPAAAGRPGRAGADRRGHDPAYPRAGAPRRRGGSPLSATRCSRLIRRTGERLQQDGRVRVRITIGADGRVTAIEQLSATHEAFWRATQRQAMSRWRFRPATVDGRPIASTMVMTVTFRIPDA